MGLGNGTEEGSAPAGMVRADKADLSNLDAAAAAAPPAPANGNAAAEIVEQKAQGKGPADPLDENDTAEWEIDATKVMCINMLAAGAFGKVFYGMYNKEDVAVKLMNLPATMTAKEIKDLKQSFKQEIAVWHKLKHPNIVEFIGASLNARNILAPADALPAAGQPVWAIVTEYMPGGTLKSYLVKKKKLTLREILRFGLDISLGLQYLHSRDIVHRDMKSDNLLMDHKNVVKIADFGVARTEAKNPVDMTCETGTVRWMAPEVIEHKPYTRKVDVYSFGIVLWELCTCEHPFKDLSFVQLAYNVVNKDLRPVIPETVNPALAEMMKQCWDKDPEKRPDFSDIVTRLEALQAELGDPGPEENTGAMCSCTIL